MVRWPDTADEILASDQAVVLGHVTPASGVVLTPLTNFGLRDRDAGKLSPLNSSIGMWKKLERLQKNPRVAVAYHTRKHGFSERPEYVLVQGTAALTRLEDRGWIERHRENWERFAGPRDVGALWERWLSVYHWRIGIEITVERLVIWPDLNCRGAASVHGPALPADAPSQSAPKLGTEPRIDHVRAAERARQLPNVLLGWVDGDGFPVVAPVEILGTAPRGMRLRGPEGLSPSGGRRAGLAAHDFARFNYGQNQRKHTGWLSGEAAGQELSYAPHTESGYRLPASKLLYRLGAGFVTRRGLREARAAGFVSA